MNPRWYLPLRFVLAACLVPSLASADLAVESVRTDRGLALDVRLDNAPDAGARFVLRTADDAETLVARATVRAQDLWLLVDSSTLCQVQKVDGYVNRLVHALRKQAAPDARVTLVTYTSETSDVLLQDAAPAKLEEAQVECERRPMSSSYDAPLARLLASTKRSDRPLAVWVFTAGNLELSRATAQALVARGAELDVVLYNAFIEKDVRPMWQAALARLGGLPARLSVLAKPDGAVTFPSQRFALAFDPPHRWLGARKRLEVEATSADPRAPALATADVFVDLPLDGWARFWRRFGTAIALGLLLFALAYALRITVRYYRAPRCADCDRRISHRIGVCLFCPDAERAYLVGAFRRRTDGFGRGVLPTTVLPLVAENTELGTHRKSVVHFPPSGRRELYFRIRREPGLRGPRFRLDRQKASRRYDLRVNGVPVGDARYLASGDEIALGPTTLVFRYGGENDVH